MRRSSHVKVLRIMYERMKCKLAVLTFRELVPKASRFGCLVRCVVDAKRLGGDVLLLETPVSNGALISTGKISRRETEGPCNSQSMGYSFTSNRVAMRCKSHRLGAGHGQSYAVNLTEGEIFSVYVDAASRTSRLTENDGLATVAETDCGPVVIEGLLVVRDVFIGRLHDGFR